MLHHALALAAEGASPSREAAYYNLGTARRRWILGAPPANEGEAAILAAAGTDPAAYYAFRPAQLKVMMPKHSSDDLATASGIDPAAGETGTDLAVTVSGEDFTDAHTVTLDGVGLATSFVDDATLVGTVPATTAAGTYQVGVTGPAGGVTVAFPLVLTDPPPPEVP